MKKIAIALLIVVLNHWVLQAQQPDTSKSMVRQFVNNAVPGMKYAPSSSGKTAGKGFSEASLAKDIREGKYGKTKAGGTAPAPAGRTANKPAPGSVPSDSSPDEARKEMEALKSRTPEPPPAQDEKKQTAPEQQGTAVKKKQE